MLAAFGGLGSAGCGGAGGPAAPPVDPSPGRPPLALLLTDPDLPATPLAALQRAGLSTLALVADGLTESTLQEAVQRACASPSIDCGNAVLVGQGRGAAWVDTLARRWSADLATTGTAVTEPRVRAVLTVDAGYTPPGRVMDGRWIRTSLADTSRWQVAMIQNRADPRASLCDADGCGVLPLAVAHGARSDPVLSACPTAAQADLASRDAWISAALRSMLGTGPALPVNGCLTALERERPLPPGPAPIR
ncbi:hypothetical protein ACWA7J_09420 [Leptothrix sp. BB-4]